MTHPHPDQDLRTALEELSSLATSGPWTHDKGAPWARISGDGWSDFARVATQNDGFYDAAGIANLNLVVTLVNAFRSGDLVLAAPPRPVDAERVAAWDGATLETRLRSYPAAPPGSDALSCSYVSSLMTEAAAALASPAHSPDKAVTREGVDAACEAAWDAYRYGTPENRGPGWNDASPRSAWHAAWSACVAALATEPTGTEAGRGCTWLVDFLREAFDEGANTASTFDRKPKEKRWSDYANEAFNTFWLEEQDRLAATPTPPVSPSPDSTGPAGDEVIAEALWDDYRANQRSITIAMARWSGLAEDSPAKIKHRRQARVVRSLAALTPSAPIAAPVRDDGTFERVDGE